MALQPLMIGLSARHASNRARWIVVDLKVLFLFSWPTLSSAPLFVACSSHCEGTMLVRTTYYLNDIKRDFLKKKHIIAFFVIVFFTTFSLTENFIVRRKIFTIISSFRLILKKCKNFFFIFLPREILPVFHAS